MPRQCQFGSDVPLIFSGHTNCAFDASRQWTEKTSGYWKNRETEMNRETIDDPPPVVFPYVQE